MIIGVPKEIKVEEYRVGLIPSFVKDIIKTGHNVFVQENAGIGAGFSDNNYKEVDAEIVKGLEDIYKKCDLIVKVKEHQKEEIELLKKGQTLFTFFHFS